MRRRRSRHAKAATCADARVDHGRPVKGDGISRARLDARATGDAGFGAATTATCGRGKRRPGCSRARRHGRRLDESGLRPGRSMPAPTGRRGMRRARCRRDGACARPGRSSDRDAASATSAPGTRSPMSVARRRLEAIQALEHLGEHLLDARRARPARRRSGRPPEPRPAARCHPVSPVAWNWFLRPRPPPRPGKRRRRRRSPGGRRSSGRSPSVLCRLCLACLLLWSRATAEPPCACYEHMLILRRRVRMQAHARPAAFGMPIGLWDG